MKLPNARSAWAAPFPNSVDPYLLDPGLSAGELHAIRRALRSETNANHLIGFAGCLSPYFPVSASLLYARSELLELRSQKTQEDLARDGQEALRELIGMIDRQSRGIWSGRAAAEWILEPVDTARNLALVTMKGTRNQWTDVADAWRQLCPPVVVWPRLARMRAACEGLAALRSPNPRLQQVGRALAQPPLLVRGRALRNMSLAESLEARGFPYLFSLTRGATLLDRADDFLSACQLEGDGTDQGRTATRLFSRRRAAVSRSPRAPVLRHAAADFAGRLVMNPGVEAGALNAGNAGVLPPNAEALARAAVTEVGPGIWIVDPAFHDGSGSFPMKDAAWAELAADRARWVEWHARSERCSRGNPGNPGNPPAALPAARRSG